MSCENDPAYYPDFGIDFRLENGEIGLVYFMEIVVVLVNMMLSF